MERFARQMGVAGGKPGYVVTGKVPPTAEARMDARDIQQQQDVDDQAALEVFHDWMRTQASLDAIRDRSGNLFHLGAVSDIDRKTIMDMMGAGQPSPEAHKLTEQGGSSDNPTPGEAAAQAQWASESRGLSGSMRDAVARQVAGEIENLGAALQNAGLPSTVGDVPLDRLQAQLQASAPQAAAQIHQLLVTGMRAVNGYQMWATMPGADESDKEPLALFPGYTEYTFNNLSAFYNAAGEFL